MSDNTLTPEEDRIIYHIGRVLARMLPDAAERRRYALLQAAAVIRSMESKGTTDEDCVGQAVNLLSEIERRDEAEGRS